MIAYKLEELELIIGIDPKTDMLVKPMRDFLICIGLLGMVRKMRRKNGRDGRD